MARSLGEIVARFGGELTGDAGRVVTGLATLEAATPEQLSFLAHPKYRGQLAQTRAGAVILAPAEAAACPCAAIVVAQPYLYYARVSQWLAATPAPAPGI
ncbi:MAG: UDP-3-O-(3-hydroxymyristoyl)glucosamine N-acyltransferase, partial [Sulfuritalea sp.]|nr:UDP-3-O-(3-hydroxymyristoyl)glucosamine N-acyltransferase [Sulfuritalea sp.]